MRDRGAIADKLKEQVGGIQNTVTNIGALIVDENINVRINGLRASLSLLAAVALIA